MTSTPLWLISANLFLIRPVFFESSNAGRPKTKKQGQNNLTSSSNFQIKLGMVSTEHFCSPKMKKKGMENFDHSTILSNFMKSLRLKQEPLNIQLQIKQKYEPRQIKFSLF